MVDNDTLFILDDDPAIRDGLSLMLSIQGYRTALFADADSFLAAWQPDWRGCLLLDIRLPGTDGLALQQKLREVGSILPVIIMTGHGDVESARQAFLNQAVDFLEKPVDPARLLAAIREALSRQATQVAHLRRNREIEAKLAQLTPREREVMDLVVAGHHNRDIAQLLDISPRTVEVHKARMMLKLQIGSLPELVRMSLGQ